jgi:sterol desaturase/sphingolipid hydroxylase (fatty acid hydroxylase superfamily)
MGWQSTSASGLITAMDIDLDTGRLAVFLGGLTFWLTAEHLFGARTRTMPLARRAIMHGGIAAFNTTFIRLLVYVPLLAWIVYVEQQGWGIARWLGLHGWPEFILSIVILDAFDYFWHRANHRVPFLWRFHKAHHHDNDMDVLTALRFHPGELLISSFVKAGWIVIWGPSAIAWFLFEVLVSLCAQMHHSNIDLPDHLERILARVIVTPRFHASHHLVDRTYGDRNFSTIFSFWDRLFGSLSPALSRDQIRSMPLGLPEARDETLSMYQLLMEPLKPRNLNLNTQGQQL